MQVKIMVAVHIMVPKDKIRRWIPSAAVKLHYFLISTINRGKRQDSGFGRFRPGKRTWTPQPFWRSLRRRKYLVRPAWTPPFQWHTLAVYWVSGRFHTIKFATVQTPSPSSFVLMLRAGNISLCLTISRSSAQLTDWLAEFVTWSQNSYFNFNCNGKQTFVTNILLNYYIILCFFPSCSLCYWPLGCWVSSQINKNWNKECRLLGWGAV